MFAVCFVGSTCAIASNFFTQVDSTHWVLDVSAAVSEQFYTLNDVSLFLVAPNSLPPEAALSLYVSVGANTAWAYRGHVSNSRPSEVMPCLWPEPGDASPAGVAHAQLGVALEPLAAAAAKRGSKVVEKEDFCKRVGMDLFQYMQSFAGVGSVGSDKLLVPANVLDKWYNRVSHRLERDPDFLSRSRDALL